MVLHGEILLIYFGRDQIHELNIFYIGTSQAKPWVAASRGMSPNEKALYTNSTLAMNPQTGKILWFFQHIQGETIDMEVGFERILADIDDKKLLLTIGKDGILWKLDREKGNFIDLKETINQNIYKKVETIFYYQKLIRHFLLAQEYMVATIGRLYLMTPKAI